LEDLKARKLPNAQDWNGGVGSAQLAWLRQRLAQAAQAHQQVIVCCHWPIYPEGAHNLWNDKELMATLESHDCVRAYLCGHNHSGEYVLKSGIHYVTFKAMLDGAERTSYAAVHCDSDVIKITGYGDEPSRVLT